MWETVSTRKGAHKLSHTPGPRVEAESERSLGHTYLLRVSQRGRRQLDLTLGMQTVVAAIFGSSFYFMDAGASKHHFGILPLAYQLLDLTLPLPTSLWVPVLGYLRLSNQPGVYTVPTTRKQVVSRPPEHTTTPGHGPAQQQMDTSYRTTIAPWPAMAGHSPSTSRPAPALGHAGPQPQPKQSQE